jgi:PAS domain S-box-containing protein
LYNKLNLFLDSKQQNYVNCQDHLGEKEMTSTLSLKQTDNSDNVEYDLCKAEKLISKSISHKTSKIDDFIEILDTIETGIYISDIETYEILFVNKYIRDRKKNIVGKKCWQVLQKGQKAPCRFCTNDKLINNIEYSSGVYQWEFQNTISKKWYHLSDQLITWRNDRKARLEIAFDISTRKRYEQQVTQNAKYLNAIVDIQTLINKADNYNRAYPEILKFICETVGADRTFIYKMEQDKKNNTVLSLFSEYQANNEIIGSKSGSIKIPLSDEFLQNYSNYYDQMNYKKGMASDIPKEYSSIVSQLKISSFLITRIKKEADEWGLIGVAMQEEKRDWSDADIMLLQAIANIITTYESLNASVKMAEESEDNFKTLVESIPIGIVVHSAGIMQYLNPAAVEIGGGDSDIDFIGKSVLSMVHPDYVKTVAERMHRVYSKDDNVGIMEEKFVKLDGTEIDVDVMASIVNFRGKPASQVVIKDITERKEIERSLRESESMYRKLIQHSNDAIYILLDNHFVIINDKFSEMFNVTLDDVKKEDFDFMSLVSPKSRLMILQRAKDIMQGEDVNSKYEFTAISKNGKEIEVEASVSYIDFGGKKATQGILRDITERKLIQAQLIQSQKMEAIGTLAGGVAHDFNNLLTVINGHAEISLMKLDKDDRLFKSLSNIFSAGKRAEKLTGQLLAFSRKQMYEPKIIEINPIILHLEKMVERIIGEDIKIEKILTENLPTIKADPAQIEQIIMNLIVNASDAIRDNDNPDTNKIITLGTLLQKGNVDNNETDQVVIKVADTGTGFANNIKDKVFEPFFTTKKQGKGTGLGLSTVYGIVKQNKANIEIKSTHGEGSEIIIYWPACTDIPEQEQIEDMANPIAIQKESKILIVEDDDDVRGFTQYALKHIGYKIYTASNGYEALQFIKREKIKIDLVFTDMIMPGIDGKELMRRVLKISPKIKVLISSGYADDFIVNNGVIDDTINFIKKPFSIKALVKKINEILN